MVLAEKASPVEDLGSVIAALSIASAESAMITARWPMVARLPLVLAMMRRGVSLLHARVCPTQFPTVQSQNTKLTM